jgi:hypothetical protein
VGHPTADLCGIGNPSSIFITAMTFMGGPIRGLISAMEGCFRGLATFQALLFVLEHSVDFPYQRDQLFRVPFNRGLFAHQHPFFFCFPLHHAYSNLASVHGSLEARGLLQAVGQAWRALLSGTITGVCGSVFHRPIKRWRVDKKIFPVHRAESPYRN